VKITHARSRKIFRPRRGAEVLELALLMLPLLWLTFGAIDFGWYFYLQHNLQGAAREGARAGIIEGNGDAKIREAVDKVMQSAGFKVGTYEAYPDYTDAGYIEVKVSMDYKGMGIPPARVTATKVEGVAKMRLESN
jgi:Flp pilus assembly protein TadG